MIDSTLVEQIKALFANSQTILVLFPAQASLDQEAAATALYLSLNRAQKVTRLVSPQLPQPTNPALLNLEDTQNELGHQNLSISFAYTQEQVDKVSYHIGEETNRFYLTIKPKPGFPPLDTENVEFTYTGATADLLITVGVNDLENLEQLYFGYEDLYRDVPIISIANYTTNFGTVKIDTGSASSLSEVVTQLIPQLDLNLDGDSATNLLVGIDTSTQQLSSMTATADTFEAVAQLLRAGARRMVKTPQPVRREQSTILTEEAIPPLHEEKHNGFHPKDGQQPPQQKNQQKNQRAFPQKNKKDHSAPPAEFTPTKRI